MTAGADANYCKSETRMTALHLLAHNNDCEAIETLLEHKADWTATTYDDLLPIDVAGTTPSLESIDTFIKHYIKENKINTAGSRSKAAERNKKLQEILQDKRRFEQIGNEPSDLKVGQAMPIDERDENYFSNEISGNISLRNINEKEGINEVNEVSPFRQKRKLIMGETEDKE